MALYTCTAQPLAADPTPSQSELRPKSQGIGLMVSEITWPEYSEEEYFASSDNIDIVSRLILNNDNELLMSLQPPSISVDVRIFMDGREGSCTFLGG